MYHHLTREETMELANALCLRCINGELSPAVLGVELMKLKGLDADERRALIAGATSTSVGAKHDAEVYARSVRWLAAYKARRKT